MRFQTKNDLHLFRFDEATLLEAEYKENTVNLSIEAIIVKGNNPNNEECVDRFADISSMRFLNASVKSIVKEGYKYYDANDRLVEEKPDEEVPVLEYDSIFKRCKKVVFYDLIALQIAEGNREYQIGVDLSEEDTYWITIHCSDVIVEWERFMNRVM